jgi:hypothetical protein
MKIEMKDVYEALTIVLVMLITMGVIWAWSAYRNRQRRNNQ